MTVFKPSSQEGSAYVTREEFEQRITQLTHSFERRIAELERRLGASQQTSLPHPGGGAYQAR